MTVTLIAAADKNGVIGVNNSLPWRLPADMAFFKAQTLHKPVLMGRKTFESMGKPLKDRTNVILSRSMNEAPEGCLVVRSVEEALERFGSEQLMVIGGEEVFRQTLPFADRIVLTEIEHEYKGDTFFPPFDRSAWKLVSRTPGVQDEKNTVPFSFCVYEKK
ncbi:dihydrofolate reductase [Cohnella pontilimi]|uniref:Dihydrofolate reductase n=1 Tax=Cohnella pontilimi TaxID=2564100 RepID=A0A4U0FGX8_9BACL|nr:dihydrofolate reductase [Cohnella pontilimi]TJY44197.1 dihydrofolate reductase [Cohnella pontilimi]